MRFTDIECWEAVAQKLWRKHRLELDEVVEALNGDVIVLPGT